jgi:hypothetical protein
LRTLICAARDEGVGWWIASFIIPGAAIAFGLRYFRDFKGALLGVVLGGILTACGFAAAIHERVQEAREAAAMTHTEDEDDGEDSAESDEAPRHVMQRNGPTPVANVSAQALPADLRKRILQLQKHHAEIIAARGDLDVGDPDAVRRFNLRAAEYHEALSLLRAEVAEHQSRRR